MRSPPSVVGYQVTGSACRRQCWTLICRVRLFCLYRFLPSTSVQRQVWAVMIASCVSLATKLLTPKRDPNPDIPVIGSLVQHDNDALHHAVTECGPGVFIMILASPVTMATTYETVKLDMPIKTCSTTIASLVKNF
ncbi:unnamed protein product [Timema podura]|uniref:Uncharacterized protein n=1 Tax=Timema podura TaxID=61482 RepID=A0ABN7NHP7_TIMPD|nr:unnamed protein product [Timema podura]